MIYEHLAADYRQLSDAQLNWEIGSRFDWAKNEDGNTALIEASRRGNQGCVEALLGAGALAVVAHRGPALLGAGLPAGPEPWREPAKQHRASSN